MVVVAVASCEQPEGFCYSAATTVTLYYTLPSSHTLGPWLGPWALGRPVVLRDPFCHTRLLVWGQSWSTVSATTRPFLRHVKVDQLRDAPTISATSRPFPRRPTNCATPVGRPFLRRPTASATPDSLRYYTRPFLLRRYAATHGSVYARIRVGGLPSIHWSTMFATLDRFC